MTVHQLRYFRVKYGIDKIRRPVNDQELQQEVLQAIELHNGEMGGKMIHSMLKEKNIIVDKDRVFRILKELDPEGHERRSVRKIERRRYYVFI